MFRESGLVPGAARHPADLSEEFEDATFPQSVSAGEAPDRFPPVLILRVVLPEGYPFRAPSFHVFARGAEARVDPEERRRVERLSDAKYGHLGLRVDDSTLSLVVPNPAPGERYLVRWSLPTLAAYQNWLGRRALTA
jgi:hypothetical protein